MTNRLALAALTLPSLVLPGAAMAHPGDHHGASPVHLLTQPDHLATIAMIAALAVVAWLVLRGRP